MINLVFFNAYYATRGMQTRILTEATRVPRFVSSWSLRTFAGNLRNVRKPHARRAGNKGHLSEFLERLFKILDSTGIWVMENAE
jgi:hypothetical protein